MMRIGRWLWLWLWLWAQTMLTRVAWVRGDDWDLAFSMRLDDPSGNEGPCDVCNGLVKPGTEDVIAIEAKHGQDAVTCARLVETASDFSEVPPLTCSSFQVIAQAHCGCAGPTTVACPVCPNGDVPPNLDATIGGVGSDEDKGEEPLTCMELMIAAAVQTDDDQCHALQELSTLICGCEPAAVDTAAPQPDCQMCKDGSNAVKVEENSTVEVGEGMTCAVAAAIASIAPDCAGFQATAGFYCGCRDYKIQDEQPSDVCRLCADGLALPDPFRVVPFDGDRYTCAELELEANSVTDESPQSDLELFGNCQDLREFPEIHDYCCQPVEPFVPTLPPEIRDIGDQCDICQNGDQPPLIIGVSPQEVLHGYTCVLAEDFAARLKQDNCLGYQATVGLYCGCDYDVTAETDICRVCGKNQEVPDPFRQLRFAGSTVTCAEVELMANTLMDEIHSDCALVQDEVGPICCFSEEEANKHSDAHDNNVGAARSDLNGDGKFDEDDTCPICQNKMMPTKVAKESKDEIMEGFTCRQLASKTKYTPDCHAFQATVGAYCGCDDYELEDDHDNFCRICGTGKFLPNPSKLIPVLGDLFTCAELELEANVNPPKTFDDWKRDTFKDCARLQDDFGNFCCQEEEEDTGEGGNIADQPTNCSLCPGGAAPGSSISDDIVSGQSCEEISQRSVSLADDLCVGYQGTVGLYCDCAYDISSEDPSKVCRLCGDNVPLPEPFRVVRLYGDSKTCAEIEMIASTVGGEAARYETCESARGDGVSLCCRDVPQYVPESIDVTTITGASCTMCEDESVPNLVKDQSTDGVLANFDCGNLALLTSKTPDCTGFQATAGFYCGCQDYSIANENVDNICRVCGDRTPLPDPFRTIELNGNQLTCAEVELEANTIHPNSDDEETDLFGDCSKTRINFESVCCDVLETSSSQTGGDTPSSKSSSSSGLSAEGKAAVAFFVIFAAFVIAIIVNHYRYGRAKDRVLREPSALGTAGSPFGGAPINAVQGTLS